MYGVRSYLVLFHPRTDSCQFVVMVLPGASKPVLLLLCLLLLLLRLLLWILLLLLMKNPFHSILYHIRTNCVLVQ